MKKTLKKLLVFVLAPVITLFFAGGSVKSIHTTVAKVAYADSPHEGDNDSDSGTSDGGSSDSDTDSIGGDDDSGEPGCP